MDAGENEPTYGSTSGPRDGQVTPPPRPIPVEQPQPAHPVAGQHEPGASALDPRREERRKKLNGLLAISGGLATVAFLVIGFAFGGWWWGWVVFLIPGLVRKYLDASA